MRRPSVADKLTELITTLRGVAGAVGYENYALFSSASLGFAATMAKQTAELKKLSDLDKKATAAAAKAAQVAYDTAFKALQANMKPFSEEVTKAASKESIIAVYGADKWSKIDKANLALAKEFSSQLATAKKLVGEIKGTIGAF
jgi:hypothetical protein